MPDKPRVKKVTALTFGDRGAEIECEVVDGRLIAEGDIEVTEEEIVTARDRRRKGLARRNRRWPEGRVPYVIAEELRRRTRTIEAAMKAIENKTPVRFVARTSEKDFVRFVKDGGNNFSSPVGMQRGEQEIRLGSSISRNKVLHEILHALGLYHEHTRPDRDQFVEILTENIDPARRFNFDISGAEPIGDYDYESVMHYEARNTFGIGGQPTMRSKTDREISPLLDGSLSDGDVAAIRHLYPEPDKPKPDKPKPDKPKPDKPKPDKPKPDKPKPDKPKPDKPKPDKPKPDKPKPDPTQLRFQGGRFKVTVKWKTSRGDKGSGRAVPGASDKAGLFYFFDRANWEILCKVLDVGPRFWVFAAAATDVEWALTVKDTTTGKVKTYRHPGGKPSPAIADTETFGRKA